jgi:hypothetical protein
MALLLTSGTPWVKMAWKCIERRDRAIPSLTALKESIYTSEPITLTTMVEPTSPSLLTSWCSDNKLSYSCNEIQGRGK